MVCSRGARLLAAVVVAVGVGAACGSPRAPLQHRWLFVWRDMRNPVEVDRMIARFPQAQADGYNGVAFSYDVPADKAAGLRQAAAAHGLDLVAIVMGTPHDHNNVEGLLVQDAPFVARGRIAAFDRAAAPPVLDADFEDADGDRFAGWQVQLGAGVTTFVDRRVAHGGHASLRIESARKSWFRPARIARPLDLTPHRQYRVSFWIKTDGLAQTSPEVRVMTPDGLQALNFQAFHVEHTQDWTHYELVFNSMVARRADLSVGLPSASSGTLWWDDLRVEEIALVNVLRRPGCPVSVVGEDGAVFEEGRDYERIVDPILNPWRVDHAGPSIVLTAGTRIRNGDRLRVSFYHSIIVGEDRVTVCLSEPAVFADWRREVEQANARLHPAAFLMSHDELFVVNQCALCRSRGLTAGRLLASNVRASAQIIRDIRPDAGIWVWSDMFDPMHNAVDRYFAARGSLRGSWDGLDSDVGVVNWNAPALGRNARFFSERGVHQILAGYYDHDQDGAAIDGWLAATAAIPGVDGAMYTTWQDNYDAMDAWALGAWRGAAAARR